MGQDEEQKLIGLSLAHFKANLVCVNVDDNQLTKYGR